MGGGGSELEKRLQHRFGPDQMLKGEGRKGQHAEREGKNRRAMMHSGCNLQRVIAQMGRLAGRPAAERSERGGMPGATEFVACASQPSDPFVATPIGARSRRSKLASAADWGQRKLPRSVEVQRESGKLVQ